MECVVCRNGNTKDGNATVTLERRGVTLVVRSVPAQVCENCGEEYVGEEEATRLLSLAEEAVRGGTQLEVRDYLAA
jgi:YgiT-type zinc finger domain-containing protein